MKIDQKLASAAEALSSLLGTKGWLQDERMQPYTTDWLGRFTSQPLGVARPVSADEVVAVVKLCIEHRLTLTPQGGNTSLVGASVPAADDRRAVLLQLGRMQQIHAIDPLARTVVVDAGVVLQHLHDALAEQGLRFPMHLGAQGTAQIGGLLSTNAGGSHVLRYGMMQDLVLGLDAVLPDGSQFLAARTLHKDNMGYPLRRLFCGAEGTLGVVTRVALRVFPAPVARATAMLGFTDMHSAVTAAASLRADAGDLVSALEFMTASGVEMLCAAFDDISLVLDRETPVLLLVELDTSSPYIDLDQVFESLLETLHENGSILDGVVASSDTQRQALWRLREEMPEAQRRLGSQLKHDVAVPVHKLAEFVHVASAAVEAISPGIQINAFGHLGDGNVHYNLSPPITGSPGNILGDSPVSHNSPLFQKASALRKAVYDCAVAMAGTVSAEHGIGQDKVGLADHYRDPVERRLMRTIKQAMDPDNRMNPGKVV